MPTTIAHDTVLTAPDGSTTYRASAYERRSRRPVATALHASVDAVCDALAHMDSGAILAVPVGEPLDNFDVVEWCAANGKHVVNRFDPWPLEHLLVENTASAA